MSRCRECQEEVAWARTSRGGTHPPLDYVGQVLTIRGGQVVEVPSYRLHACDPAAVERERECERTAAAVRAESEAQRRLAWRLARLNDCLRCGARPGEGCYDITKAKAGVVRLTSWPHQERFEAEDLDVAEEVYGVAYL